MTNIGISPDEARHLVSKQSSLTDEMRAHVNNIDGHITSLAHGTYISETTQALQAKWESETKPQFMKIIARAEEAQSGTNSGVDHQLSTQGSNASAIKSL